MSKYCELCETNFENASELISVTCGEPDEEIVRDICKECAHTVATAIGH